MELFFKYANPDGSCPDNLGGTNPGYKYTYPNPRGSCVVQSIHATAFVQDTPGGDPRIVDEEDWAPAAPDSQDYSDWVVLQLQNSAKIQVLHVMD